MGIYNDIALRRLPEDLGQPHHREGFGTNHVLQDTARSHTGKLVHIAHQNQPGSRYNGL